MSFGWISIHRQIQSHWVWEDKPFSKGQAWIDLLMMANHTDKKILLGNELVEVKAGSFITSELKLADKWGWSKTKVRSFMALLENDKMIVQKKDRKKTTITIENYSDFQVLETEKKPQKDHKKTTKKPQKNTNNNVNNDNNINNILYADNPALNETIIAFVEHRKSMKKPMTDRAIKLMITNLNKLSPDVNVQIDILNQSIINGWQGIFPLKNQNNQKKGSGRKEVVPDWMDKQKKKNNFNNYPQREYDMDKLEKDLLKNQRKEAGNKTDLSERIAALKEKLGQ